MKYSIAFVKPRGEEKIALLPPLGLLRLASLTPNNYSISIIDENVERIKLKKYDIVAISVWTGNLDRSIGVAKRFRDLGCKVLMGGIQTFLEKKKLIKHCDSLVIGEVEEAWGKILEDFECNKLKKEYNLKFPDISNLPLIDWNLIKGKKYLQKYVIQTSRGCPYNCDFCTVTKYNGRKVRHSRVEDVIREIENIRKYDPKARSIAFLDDNLTIDKKYAKKLFKALIPYKIRWYCQCSIDFADDEELLKLAKLSGCAAVFVGLESISQASLDSVNKKFSMQTYRQSIARIKKYDIIFMAAIIFGFDFDEKNIFQETLDFCEVADIDFVLIHPLGPLVGTKLYDSLESENRIDKYGRIIPTNMTTDYLHNMSHKTYNDFYSIGCILRRLFRYSIRRDTGFLGIFKYLGVSILMKLLGRRFNFKIFN